MRNILYALDPGTHETAIVKMVDGKIARAEILQNAQLLAMLRNGNFRNTITAIESIASYGMAVGKETFETCEWCGRFREAVERNLGEVRKVYRKDVKIHLCGTVRAKDGNISQALRDKYGDRGTKKNPGPTYGISKHMWAALAVADYALTKG